MVPPELSLTSAFIFTEWEAAVSKGPAVYVHMYPVYVCRKRKFLSSLVFITWDLFPH